MCIGWPEYGIGLAFLQEKRVPTFVARLKICSACLKAKKEGHKINLGPL